MADAASAERAMLRVCRSGLDITELQRRVLSTLRTAITIDAAYFATADPESLLITGAVSEDPLIAMAPLLLDNELTGPAPNTSHFVMLGVAARGGIGPGPSKAVSGARRCRLSGRPRRSR
jgi:hypothetical protein